MRCRGRALARARQASGSWERTRKIIFEGKKKIILGHSRDATPQVKITGVFFHPMNMCRALQEGG